MATTRFCKPTDNKLWKFDPTALTPAIVNGDEATYPGHLYGVKQDPQHPMTNLLVPGIYGAVWDTGPSPGAVTLEVEVSPVSCALVAFLNIRGQVGPVGGVSVQSSTDFWGPPSYGGNIVNGSLLGYRHQGFVIGSPSVGRFFKFVFGNPLNQRFSIGAIYVGSIPVDLGIVHSPNAAFATVHTTVESRNGAGHLSVMGVGDSRGLVSLPLYRVQDALKAKVDGVFGQQTRREPVLWIDELNAVRPVVVQGELRWRREWRPPNLWSVDLEMEALG